MVILNRENVTEVRHAKAKQFARNYVRSNNRQAYATRKTNEYGVGFWSLVQRYVTAIAEAEAANPDRCRAHIDDEAEKIVRGTK